LSHARCLGDCAVSLLLSLAFFISLLPLASAPSTGIIRTLFIGDAFMLPGFPMPALVEDPKISVTPILAEVAFVTKTEMQRFMRIYLPRTQERLVQNYDLVIISALKANDISGAFEKWIKVGVTDYGLGLLMVDDPVSFGCVDAWNGVGSPSWMPTPVGQVLPVDDNSRLNWGRGNDFKIKAVDPNHPLIKGIQWEEVWFYAHNRPTARQGATVVATTWQQQGNAPKDMPFLVYWDVGKAKGRTMALVFDWGGRGMSQFYLWGYWKDAVARWAYFPAKAKIPEDVELTHRVRQLISDYTVKRGIVLSMIEFADNLGANTRSVEKTLAEVGDERTGADDAWIEARFTDSEELMTSSLSHLDVALQQAVKAKNAALFWIYMIEWTTVTGTACITGVVLWTLMIKRKAYHEITTTRFSR